MLTFEFEIASENNESVDALSLGHITVKGRSTNATSKGRTPDQSMMIFLALVELLDGVRRFSKDEKSDLYNFVGTDSSFQIFITRTKAGHLSITCDDQVVDEVAEIELVRAIWSGADAFVARYGHYLHSDDIVTEDLISSLDEFERIFNLTNETFR